MRKAFSWGILLTLATFFLLINNDESIVYANSNRSSHIGLFNGETTFSLSSETGILSALEVETKDVHGSIEAYDSGSGNVTIPENEGDKTVKSAILKGQTLVNIDSYYDRSDFYIYGADFIDEDGYIQLTARGAWVNAHTRNNSLVKPNTKYAIIVDIKENTLDSSMSNALKICTNTDTLDSVWSDWSGIEIAGGVTGRLFFTATTSDNVSGVKMLQRAYVGSSLKTGHVKYRWMIIEYQEGMENWDITFFKGSQSVVNPILTISNEDNSQTAIVSIEGNITLRSNGDIYDELDLMTGKLTQRIDENGNVLGQEIIRYVKIHSTHTFEVPNEGDVSVVGSVVPTIVSIDVPSEALSFTLNPNLEVGQQFIASDFSISNNSQAPIKLGIQSFEQTTTLLNDVLPDKYDSWVGLNKTQSKDIVLALEPQPSDSWISLNEGSYYVANTSSVELGRIKGNSSVNFKFSALHGQAFAEPLNPQYKLTFVFEL